MKKAFTLLAILAIGFSAIGQTVTLSIDPCPSHKDGSIWELVKAEANLSHSGATEVNLAWERMTVTMPSEWSTSVCDPNQCYAPFADEPLGPSSELITFNVAAGGTVTGETFYVQFIPNGVPGTGTVTLRVYEDGNENNSVTCDFSVSAVATAIGDLDIETAIVFYPNPVSSIMHIAAPLEAEIKAVEIYNIVGKRVKHYVYPSQRTKVELDLSDLREGIYFARMLGDEGQLVTSRRFSKIN